MSETMAPVRRKKLMSSRTSTKTPERLAFVLERVLVQALTTRRCGVSLAIRLR